MLTTFHQTHKSNIMKNIFLIGLLFVSITAFAQDGNETPINNDERAKIAQTIDALKVAYITKELNLTPDEAQKFWPIYNGFSNEIKKARIDFKQDDLAFEEKKVIIMKRYKEDFKKVLNSDSRVNKCFKAEPEFHKILKAEWVRRREFRMQGRQQNGASKPPAIIKNKNNKPPYSPQGHRGHREQVPTEKVHPLG